VSDFLQRKPARQKRPAFLFPSLEATGCDSPSPPLGERAGVRGNGPHDQKRHWTHRILFIAVLASVLVCLLNASLGAAPLLTNGFAHNDYEHKRPLFDALELGFCAVEADIYLVNGQLLIGHDAADLSPRRTLRALYLDPLKERVTKNGGKVHRGGPEFLLLIDVKSEAEPTYAALETVLTNYSAMLTWFSKSEIQTNAIRIVLSGNRATEMVSRQATRLVAIDGRLPDLEKNPPVPLIPLVSDNWTTIFKWKGDGPMPDSEKLHLSEIVTRAHQQGRQFRLWAAPDTPESWRIQQEAGVDLINTDKLADLAEALRGHAGASSQ